jgi:hypothetical protein
MPSPLAPHHYPQASRKGNSLVAPGTVVHWLRSFVYLVIWILLGVTGWWVYVLRNYPQTRTLHEANGKRIAANIQGRSDQLIKYTVDGADGDYYIAITDLSLWDQAEAWVMPLNLMTDFPVVCTVRDQNGRSTIVQFMGRTADTVRFAVVKTGVVVDYPLEKLSPEDQSWIELMPINSLAPLKERVNSVYAENPTYQKELQDKIAELQQDVRNNEAFMSDPMNTGIDREVYQKQISDDNIMIEHLQKTLAAIQQKDE